MTDASRLISALSMNGELWKDIPEYEGLYKASNFGKILSLGRVFSGCRDFPEKLLKQSLTKSRYFKVALCKAGVPKTHTVHRITAKLFVPGYSEGLVVNHLDSNPRNNHYTNLEWVTQEVNMKKGAIYDSSKRNKTT